MKNKNDRWSGWFDLAFRMMETSKKKTRKTAHNMAKAGSRKRSTQTLRSCRNCGERDVAGCTFRWSIERTCKKSDYSKWQPRKASALA